MSDNDAIIDEFLTESYENLDQLDRDLIELEQNPEETSILASIFRTIHTIKGTCGFLGFSKLESVAHVGENLLSKLRDGVLPLTPGRTSALLAMVDAIRQILGCIESDRNEGDVDYSLLVETLTWMLEPDKEDNDESAPAPASVEEPVPEVAETPEEEVPVPEEIPEANEASPCEETSSSEEAPAAQAVAAPVIEERRSDAPDAGAAASSTPNRRAGDKRSVADSSIRVDVDLLDTLMNLVGELVLARNQILQYSTKGQDSTLTATSQHLNLVTTELQEGVMKTRMQPIGNIWDKFPRVVRDLSIACGKKIRLEMEGKETELDKTLIEAIKDPLTHIVRNSVDHGVEMPDVRAAAGKPEEGVLKLRSFHEGGQVNIEIIDDGGGIDPEKIKAKALDKNVITQEQAAKMSDRELVNLVFAPGFSTAAQVTNVSGRGVGMDVVKTNIEKIGGTVDIQSQAGEGTTLKVKIPLTLAIIPALTVTCGADRFAIPQVNLLELVRLDAEQAKTSVELIQGTPVYRLRGNLLPLIYLNEELQVENHSENKAVNIVVLQADNRQFGLVVEGIHDTEEIVVKPLGKQLSLISAFSGATIMGDGTVALILDVMGLAQKARVVSEGRDHAAADKETSASMEDEGERQTLLILRVGENERMAIPLSAVARLEEFKTSDVEFTGDREVVQYRGEIMPLVHLCDALNAGPRNTETDSLHAVVYSRNDRSVGLVVDQILDIVEENITVKRSSQREGMLGTVVVQDRVTDLVDVDAIVIQADPAYAEMGTVLVPVEE